MKMIKKLSLFAFGLVTLAFSACGSPSDFTCTDANRNTYNLHCTSTISGISAPNLNTGQTIYGDDVVVDCPNEVTPDIGTTCVNLVPSNAPDGRSYLCPIEDTGYLNTTFYLQNTFGIAPPVSGSFLQDGDGFCSLVLQW